MKCIECIHQTIAEIKRDHAFDTEFSKTFITNAEYCDHHNDLCCDAYLNCEYRDLEVTAEEIQHVINLLTIHSPWTENNIANKELAITELNKLLEG